jgi:hypothetical protein
LSFESESWTIRLTLLVNDTQLVDLLINLKLTPPSFVAYTVIL